MKFIKSVIGLVKDVLLILMVGILLYNAPTSLVLEIPVLGEYITKDIRSKEYGELVLTVLKDPHSGISIGTVMFDKNMATDITITRLKEAAEERSQKFKKAIRSVENPSFVKELTSTDRWYVFM